MATEERVILLKTDIDNSSAIKANAELTQSIAKLKLEQKDLKSKTNGLTTATDKQAQAYVKTDAQIKSLQEDSRKYTKILKDQTKEQKANQKIVTKTNGSINSLRNALNINRDAYRSLTKHERENTVAGKQLVAVIQKQDKEYKDLSKTIGNSQANVGNYTQSLNGLKKVFGALGITFAITQLVSLGKELLTLSQESRGVQFAFEKLGDEGVDAFDRVKAATRGTLSNLDIKRSLVEFDNFNISLAETDTLFEFLAVRATQTGVSVDKLKQSLVEGLSKESKLRIDNLGISAKQLNNQLKLTPNFVEAVATIAKSEIAEAGGILDEAANSQSKWNAEIANAKEAIANNLGPAWSSFLSGVLGGLNIAIEKVQELFNPGGSNSALKKSVEESKVLYNDLVTAGIKEGKTREQASAEAIKQEQNNLNRAKAFRALDFKERLNSQRAFILGKSKAVITADGTFNDTRLDNEIKTAQARLEAVSKIETNAISRAAEKAAKAEEKRKAEADKGTADAIKRAEEISGNTLDITRQNITFNLSLIKDAGEKELAINKNKYDVLREDTLANEKLTNDQKTNLKNLYDQQEIEASRLINVKITEDKIAEQEKYYKKIDSQVQLLESLRNTDQENEIASLVLNYENKFLLALDNAELEKELAIKLAEELAIINDKYNKIETDSNKKTLAVKQATEQEKLNAVSNSLSGAQTLFKEESEAYKVIAIAQASIATYLAANKALTAGPILGPILAGITIATGLANVTKIAGFAEGSESTGSLGFADYSNHTGMITGKGNISPLANGDNMLATIKTGEAILNDKQQGRLNNLLGFDAIKYAVKGYADGTTFTGASQTGAITNNVVNNSKINNNSQSQENITYIVDVKDVAKGLEDLTLKVTDATI